LAAAGKGLPEAEFQVNLKQLGFCNSAAGKPATAALGKPAD
jgi:hypothetical protein